MYHACYPYCLGSLNNTLAAEPVLRGKPCVGPGINRRCYPVYRRSTIVSGSFLAYGTHDASDRAPVVLSCCAPPLEGTSVPCNRLAVPLLHEGTYKLGYHASPLQDVVGETVLLSEKVLLMNALVSDR